MLSEYEESEKVSRGGKYDFLYICKLHVTLMSSVSLGLFVTKKI